MDSKKLVDNPFFNLPNDKMKVVSFKEHVKSKRSIFITLIVALNLIGWISVLAIRLYNYYRFQLPVAQQPDSFTDKILLACETQLTSADFIWFSLSILFSAIGLWNMKSWGWGAAIMANTTWMYSMTLIVTKNLSYSTHFEVYFFLTFTLIALLSTLYLWKNRYIFWR